MKISEIPDSLLNFFFNKSRSHLSKGVLVIILSFFLIVADNFLGFLYYYNTEKKMSQIKEANEILHDTTLTKQDKISIIELRTNIINHKNWKDRLYAYFSDLLSFNPSHNRNEKYYDFWFFLTSIIVWIILIFALPISVFLGRADIPVKFVIYFEVIFIAIACAQFQLLALIPTLWGHPILNYILNLLINFWGTLFVAYQIEKSTKKK